MNRKAILTLMRVGEDYTYVSRSFEKIDDKAIAAIRGCIREENCEALSVEEIEERYLPAFGTLKETFGLLGDNLTDFSKYGHCIWEYYDGVESFRYVLHVSVIETDEKPVLTEDELRLLSDVCHCYKDGYRGDSGMILPVMELERKLAALTDGAYEPDTTYDV